jgi:hypothetical protein
MHGANLQRLGIKLFAAGPSPVALRDFVPVFHSWIQNQSMAGHLLIDVHDYSHIHNGPGILLVAHEANFSMDLAEGQMGLLYYRKQPAPGALKDRIAAALRSTLSACSLLETEAVFEGKLRFRTDELLFLANDRLHAPNIAATLPLLQKEIAAGMESVLGEVSLTFQSLNPKDRFAVKVRAGRTAPLKDLVQL